MDSIRKVSVGFGSVNQELRNPKSLELIELRLNVLETKMSQVFDNQDQIMARMGKVENDLYTATSLNNSSVIPVTSSQDFIRADSLDAQTSDLNNCGPNAVEPDFLKNESVKTEEDVRERTNQLTFMAHVDTAPVNEEETSVSNKQLTVGRDDVQNYSVTRNHQGYQHFHNSEYITSYETQNINRSSPFVQDTSTCTSDHESNKLLDSSTHQVKKSMPTLVSAFETVKVFLSQPNFLFSGKKDEDPTQFIINWECILQEANVNITDWVKTVELQLMGTALEWMSNIKKSDLSWSDFKVKFSERFISFDIQSHLRVNLMTIRQNKSQCLTNFVLEKIQLARQVQTGLSEAQIVNIIIGLMREPYSTHVKLWYPTTLMELMRVARMLDFSLIAKPIQNF